jgi:hypothetical protein
MRGEWNNVITLLSPTIAGEFRQKSLMVNGDCGGSTNLQELTSYIFKARVKVSSTEDGGSRFLHNMYNQLQDCIAS